MAFLERPLTWTNCNALSRMPQLRVSCVTSPISSSLCVRLVDAEAQEVVAKLRKEMIEEIRVNLAQLSASLRQELGRLEGAH